MEPIDYITASESRLRGHIAWLEGVIPTLQDTDPLLAACVSARDEAMSELSRRYPLSSELIDEFRKIMLDAGADQAGAPRDSAGQRRLTVYAQPDIDLPLEPEGMFQGYPVVVRRGTVIPQ